MQLKTQRFLTFGSRFALSFVMMTILWVLASPFYNSLILSISTLVLAAIEDPRLTFFREEADHAIVYVQSLGSTLPIVTLTKEFYNLNYFGIVVLWALMLATPMRLSSKALFVFIATLCMIFFHVLFLLVYLRIQYIVKGIVPSDDIEFIFYVWLRFFTTTGKYWLPPVIWALLTFHYWFPQSFDKSYNKEARP